MIGKSIRKTIVVKNMECEGCAKRIINTLSNIAEVKKSEANLDKKEISIVLKKDLDDTVIKEKIENIGFMVEFI